MQSSSSSRSPAGSGLGTSTSPNTKPRGKTERILAGTKRLLHGFPSRKKGNMVLDNTAATATSTSTPLRPTVSSAAPTPGAIAIAAIPGGPALTGSSAPNAPGFPLNQASVQRAGKSPAVALAHSNSSSNLKWATALAKLSSEDQQVLNFGSSDKLTILAEVLKATEQKRDICIQEQWKCTWKGKTIILRDVADKLLAWINKFKSIGDIISSFDPTHAALPWAGFRFLLQISVDESQKMGALLIGLEVLANLMGRCAIHEGLYLGNSGKSAIQFEKGLIGLYTCVLRYLARAKQYFCKNAAARVAFSIFDTEQESLLDDVHKQEDIVLKLAALVEAECSFTIDRRLADEALGGQISNATGILDKRITEKSKELTALLGQFTEPIPRMELSLKALHDGLGDEERTKILIWLSNVEYEKHHLNASEGRVDGTGEWLSRKKVFLEWQKSSVSTILWLHGIPGAGKTKLTSRVIEKLLEQRERKNSGEAIAYFYCKRDETGPTDPEVVMSAIVKQLSCLRAGDPLRQEATDVYKTKKKSGFSSNSLGFEESLGLIISLVGTYPQTTIVVDALDECDPQKRKRLLESLNTIVYKSTSLVKILVSSRDDNDIVLRLDGVPNLWIETTDNQEDIERFIHEEVTRCIKSKDLLCGNVDKELESRIINSLVSGSQGMFLWADLQIKEICSMDLIPDVEARLGKLPKTLEDTYIEIYKHITSQRGSSPGLAQHALMWVMCSGQPFSPDDLVAMLSIRYNTGNSLNASVLYKVCHNLLVPDHQRNIVRFAHLSVREFLENNRFSTVDAHTMAAETCLSYLITFPKYLTQSNLPNSKLDFSHWYLDSVVGYVHSFWPTHVQRCLDQQEGLELPEMLMKFLNASATDWHRNFQLIEKYSSTGTPNLQSLDFRPLSPLHVATMFGFGEKIKRLWDSELWDVNAKNIHGETALYIASRKGYLWIVTTLLDKDTDVNAQGGADGNALQAAASLAGNEKVVGLLLEKGADANAQGGFYRNALQAAARLAGNEKVVGLLLEKGADVNAQGGYYGNALQAAARLAGNEKMVGLLLEKGADVNAQGGHYGNALQAAARLAGNEKVVGLLLEKGADVNSQGGRYGNALQAAARLAGNEKMVGLLLEKGADVNSQSGYYGNALQEAARLAGNEKVVGLLLEKGADVNSQGGYYGNALQAVASVVGNEKVVGLLLEKGADVNSQGGRYGNALQAAASLAGNEKVVRLLLEKGADVNAQGGVYRNALQAAASLAGNEKVVGLLLKCGAN